MLANINLNNEEKLIYTCPTGKKAYIFLRIYSQSTSSITIKINDILYFSNSMSGLFIEKFSLDTGDAIKVSANSQVSVFVDGMEV